MLSNKVCGKDFCITDRMIDLFTSDMYSPSQTIQVIQPSHSTTFSESDEHCFVEFDNIVSQAINISIG